MKRIAAALLLFSTISYAQWEPNGIPVCDTSANSGFYMLPQIAAGGNGDVFTCWRDGRSGDFDIYVQHIYSDGTMQFPHNGISICDAPYSQQFPRIISDGRAGAYIAWEDDRAVTQTYIYVQRINSVGQALWMINGVRAAETGGLFISLALNTDGGVLLGWSTVENAFVQRLDSLGNRMWGDNGVQVTSRPGNVSAGNVSITDDGDDGAIVAWSEGNVIYAQRIDSTGIVRWQTNGIPLSDSTHSGGGVALCSDLRDGVVISWSEFRPTVPQDTANMFVQRVSPTGLTQWNPTGVYLGKVGAGGAFRNISDGIGGAFVGYWNRIQHVDSSGNPVWPAPGVSFTERQTGIANSSQTRNSLLGIWNLWTQFTDQQTSIDIYAQYIDGKGNRWWEPDGKPVCVVTNLQDYARVAATNEGFAIVVWDDFRNGHSNVYAAQLDTNGVITSIPEGRGSVLPFVPTLDQNYPNPFNPETTIAYFLPSSMHVKLSVFDLLGRELATLADEDQLGGRHEVKFRGKNLGSGVYFYRLIAASHILTGRMLVMR